MALSVKLELRQSQQLVMTPQLQQAIRLLQLSNIELAAYVETELERNPLLDPDDASDSPAVAGAEALGDGEASADVSVVTETAVDVPISADAASDVLDTDVDNVYPDTPAAELIGATPTINDWTSVRSNSGAGSGEGSNLEAFVACELTLKDHLSEQLNLAISDPVERLVGNYLIDCVDEAGYLHAAPEDLADKVGAPDGLVERVLEKLQMFDPPGIFARSLAESLALQLKEQNRYDPQIASLLENLNLLAAHDINGLRRTLGVDAQELAEMIADIKQLNPKPGLKYGSVMMQPVVPDVMVRLAPDGSWLVELNTETLPRVLVNRSYYTTVSRTTSSERDKGYLLDCLQNANWLVKSLDQRAKTILKVAEEIVRQQDGFLTYGVSHLRPLNLKTVAEAISMHESTVSRVTSNKYIATSRGIFELKYFFTSSIASSADGDAHSSEAVRHKIKLLIDAETVKNVLSDDKIVERLRIDGVEIARRTVAKYREAMRIPSSVQRRREKRSLEAQLTTA